MRRTCAFILALAFSAPALAQDTTAPRSADAKPPAAPPAATAAPATKPSPAPPATLDEAQIKDLIAKASENDLANDRKQRDYTYMEREEERKLNGKGELQSTETRTSEVLMLYGSQVERLVAKNDKPLSDKDAAREEERIQKIIDKRKNESDGEREKRLKREEKDREEGRQWVKEISDAYNFRLEGIEDLNGRPAYVIDGEPRPGFQPHLKYANYLSKFRFRAWIDQADAEWARLDIECIDTVSWGLFVARIHKGARILVDQVRVNDEVWLPRTSSVKLDVRLALLKTFHVDQFTTYSDYRKFRTETRIVGMGEVQPPK